MVVQALQFEQHGSEHLRLGWRDAPDRLLDCQTKRQVVADRGVARDPFGELDPTLEAATLEESLDALVHEPQPGLHVEDRLADDRETEVAGFDDTGVHRADGDLVHTRTLDGQERIRRRLLFERGRRTGVVTHRMPAAGPVLMQDQPCRLMVTDWR